jgi:hypothetical protein
MLPNRNHLRTILGCIFLLIFTLPTLCRAQNNAASGKIYKILLSNGREISCSHYYERDGKIITVRPFGEVAYSKEEVSEIRDQSANAAEPGAAADPVAATPRIEPGAAGCKYPATMWFQADLRRLPRNAAAANTRIDELIAREKARIVELKGQLPGLRQKAETKAVESERKIEQALADYGQYAEDQSKHGIRGEDVIAVAAQASGTSTVAGPVRGMVIIEDSTKFQINAAEKDIERCLCNIFWAEKKRSEKDR